MLDYLHEAFMPASDLFDTAMSGQKYVCDGVVGGRSSCARVRVCVYFGLRVAKASVARHSQRRTRRLP
jgi:hypothetical protein